MDHETIIDEAVARAATATAAAAGQHLLSQLLASVDGLELVSPAADGDVEHLGDRLRAGGALTALADAAGGLGELGARPGTVKDLLAVRSVDGWSVGRELDRLCAQEASRRAPAIAAELARDHEGLGVELIDAHRVPPTVDDQPVDPHHALVAAVAAGLSMALLAQITDRFGDLPLRESSPAVRH